MNPLRKALRALARPISRLAARMDGRPRASVFRGATSGRLTDDWYPTLLSADQELKADGRLLRSRSRQMVRDDPHAAGFVTTIKNNVIGVEADGIGLQCRNRLADGTTFDVALNRHIEERFCTWGLPETASADGRQSWGDLQRMYVANLAIDGEVLYRLLPGFGNAFGFAVQFLDPDQLGDHINRPATDTSNEIRQGVEVDGYNRAVAYWLRPKHPSEPGGTAAPVRVPAGEVFHDFIQLRPGQTRGCPWLTPALFTWRMMAGYTEGEVVQARNAANNGGYFVSTGTDAEMWTPPVVVEGQRDALVLESEPGVDRALPPGVTWQERTSSHPNGNYAQFQKAMLRPIFTSLGISYTTGAGDFENTNYSSGRMGLLPERDFFRWVARFVAVRFNRRVFDAWLPIATLYGAVQLPSFDAAAYATHVWQFRGWPWIDPLNDAQANERLLRLGLTTRTRLAAEQGLDFNDLIDEQAAELAYAASKGVNVAGVESDKALSRATDSGTPDEPPDPAEQDAENDANAEAMADRVMARIMPSVVAMAPREPVQVRVEAPQVTVYPPNIDVHVDAQRKATATVVERDEDGAVIGSRMIYEDDA